MLPHERVALYQLAIALKYFDIQITIYRIKKNHVLALMYSNIVYSFECISSLRIMFHCNGCVHLNVITYLINIRKISAKQTGGSASIFLNKAKKYNFFFFGSFGNNFAQNIA